MESRRLGRYLNFKGKKRCLRHFGPFWMSGCGSSKGCSSGEETLEIYRQNSGTKVGVSVSSLGWSPLTTDVHWPVGHYITMSQPPLFAEERNLFMGGFSVSENVRIRLGMMEEKPERRQVRPKKSVEWEKGPTLETSSLLTTSEQSAKTQVLCCV